MFNLLVIGVMFFGITAVVTIYCLLVFSARLDDTDGQYYDSQVNEQA